MATRKFKMNKTANYLIQISSKEQKTPPQTVVVPNYYFDSFIEEFLADQPDRVVLVSAVDTFQTVDASSSLDDNIIGSNL